MKREKFPDWYQDDKPIEHINVKIGRENKENIRRYYLNNPNAFQKQCAKDLGISQGTVWKHLRDLRNEG